MTQWTNQNSSKKKTQKQGQPVSWAGKTYNLCYSHFTVFSLRPRPHYAGGIWKQRFHSENASNIFRSHYAGGIWKRRFHSENASNIFRSHYAGGIWKRRFHSENASNVFRSHYTGGSLKRQKCITGHFGLCLRKNSDWEITWLPWRHRCRKAHVFKMFSVHTKTKSRRQFSNQIPLVWREIFFPKTPFSCRISVDGRPNRRNKVAFSWRIGVNSRLNCRNKAAFSCRISVDGGPNCRNRVTFSNFTGAVWTGAWMFTLFKWNTTPSSLPTCSWVLPRFDEHLTTEEPAQRSSTNQVTQTKGTWHKKKTFINHNYQQKCRATSQWNSIFYDNCRNSRALIG